MSGARVELIPEARREIEDAFDWYIERSAQAAEAFVREVERALALIASSPSIWPRFEAGTRRYILRLFPYDIIYREVSTGLEVVAVAAHKRRPGYWRQRLARSHDP